MILIIFQIFNYCAHFPGSLPPCLPKGGLVINFKKFFLIDKELVPLCEIRGDKTKGYDCIS
jgi:hypothetical protein